jgi:multicomponent Na+:H+ antiporter subunit D
MLSSLLNIAYLMPIPIRGFLKSAAERGAEPETVQEAPWACVIPLCFTAVASVILFFFADSIYQVLQPVVESSVPS